MQPSQNDTQKNSGPEAVTSDPPEQRKILTGPSATFIVSEAAPKNNSRGEEVNRKAPPISAGGLRRHCLHLGDADRAAIQKIREELELPSSALAVRLAIRKLAERLAQKSILADTQRGKP